VDIQGVVLFADLAGFTSLAEAFARSGAAGGESLHALLNGYFAILIDQVGAAGGEVTTFAGDALAAVFDADGQGIEKAAGRALRCAVGVQGALSAFSARNTTAVGVHPHMRVGLGAGAVTRALVGEHDVQVLHVLAGVALERAVAGQRQCRQGEVVAEAGLVASAPDLQVADSRGRWSVLGSPSMGDVGLGYLKSRTRKTRAREQRLVDEHRLVTSAFLALPDMDVPRDGGARLQSYLREAIPVIRHYGGDLRQVDAGDKGYQLVMGFGAPRTTPDDAERAVACCLQLVGLPTVPVRAGVATGPAFCAEVGTSARREYVVIGDSVNVAARLAQGAAPGQVRVDGATSARCETFARRRSLGPLRMKGRAVPVDVFAVDGLHETTRVRLSARRGEFVGRNEELAVARGVRERAHRGHGQVLLVTGEPGMGKSRLLAEIPNKGEVVAVGAGGVPGDARPYLAWRSIWRTLLFGSGDRAPTPAQVASTLASLGEHERAPLLGAVLGVPVPDNGFTASLTPAQRADATRAISTDCLRRLCERSPITLVVDDAQWLDELSQDLLTHLAANISDLPVLIIVGARDERLAVTLLGRLSRAGSCTELSLAGLRAGEAEQLVRAQARVHGSPLTPQLVSGITQRGGGNPLYLAQLVSWTVEHPEALDPERLPEFPENVVRLVLARVDRLLPQGQATLKAASVIADGFSAAAIHACRSSPGGRRKVERDLQQLVNLELISARPGAPEITYGFRHALVQEVVYGSLSTAARAHLHEAVAQHFELAHADDLAGWVDRLAHHYGRSTNETKQRTWFRAAGDAAAHAYANEAAVRYYQRLVRLLPETERPELLVRLGAIHQLTGRWHEGEQVLREALTGARAQENRSVEAEAERELGLVLLRTRSFSEAVERLRSAADEFAALDDSAGQARSLDRLAYALMEHGDYRAALDVAEEQLAVEGRRDDSAGLAAALENVGLVRWRYGEYAAAMSLLRRAYALALRSGDRRLIVHTANDLAGLCAERGDHRSAVRHLRKALTTAKHIGYREATAYLTGNAGELYRDHGDFAEAERHFAAGLCSAMDVGDWLTMVFCLAMLAVTAADQAAPGHRELLARAAEIAGQLHQSYVQADLLLRRAEAAFDAGDLPDALQQAQRAESAARRLSERGPTLRPHLLRLRVEVATGCTLPDEAFREVASMLPEWPDPPERALLLDTLTQIDRTRQPAWEAADLYRELYAKAASRRYATAYERLTGSRDGLPAAEALPRLAEDVTAESIDLETLFTRVEELAASAPAAD
jgi:class 3 adenylate cyclase/predicted ATPase